MQEVLSGSPYFKGRLAQWVKDTRSRYKKKWSKQYEVDGSNPDALGMSSWISPTALNLFFRDKMGDPDDRRLEQLVGNLENDDNDYFLLRELLNDFLRNQDFFEANVIIIRMSKLQRRVRADNPDFQLLCTYLAACSLRGTSLDNRKKAYATLSAEKLLAYGDKPGMFMGKLNSLADIDLWGLREAVDGALRDTDNALRGFLRKERKCLNLRNELDELICSAIKKKITTSGIGLAVVDEVHNWKSGESNGAKFFRECLGQVIPNKLVMSATPIQLEEGEMRTIFSVIAGEDKDDKSLLAVQDATEPAGICVRPCLKT